ncbi:MAG TPA: sigma-70 family RNA polymerase sigma factor [Pirellulaceae bacterium]|nr:sigma-70 family RNA polymerase sigma factor [Pirellulaceae bacterium]
MSDITHLLGQAENGVPRAAEQLLPLVYDELRKLAAARLAQERPGQTLQATALVHEAYLRLVKPGVGDRESGVGENLLPATPDPRSLTPGFDSRGHFFAAAAEAMRRILIEQARRRGSQKHGGGRGRQPLEHVEIAAPEPSLDIVALDEALEKFERVDPLKAQLVKLRYFAGLTIPQAAEALGISSTTADRYWAYARAWLHTELKRGDETQAR